jgi:predicted nucleic acid-binding protein
MENAVNVAPQYRFKGADSIIAALAEELDLPLRTADGEMLDRLERASP